MGWVLHGVDQMGEIAAETVEFPDHENVALPQGAQAAVEPRPVVATAGSEVVVKVGHLVDVLQLSRIRKKATGWVDQTPSHAATPTSLLMN